MRVAMSVWLVIGLAVLCAACGGSSDEAPKQGKNAAVRKDGDGGGRRDRVTMRTPAGKVEIGANADLAKLAVEVYPGARLDEDGGGVARVEAGGVVSVSATFRSDDSRDDIVAFYRKRLPGAMYVSTNDGSVITAEPSDGVTVQVVVSDDPDEDEREIAIVTMRSE